MSALAAVALVGMCIGLIILNYWQAVERRRLEGIAQARLDLWSESEETLSKTRRERGVLKTRLKASTDLINIQNRAIRDAHHELERHYGANVARGRANALKILEGSTTDD